MTGATYGSNGDYGRATATQETAMPHPTAANGAVDGRVTAVQDNDRLLHLPAPVHHHHPGRRRRLVLLVAGGVCAVVAVACILFLPRTSPDVSRSSDDIDDGGVCALAKAGFYGTTPAATSFYFARAAVPSSSLNSSSLPLLVHFSHVDPQPAQLPCISSSSSTTLIRNPVALNRDAHVLYLRVIDVASQSYDMHAFLASTLRAANINAKREILFLGDDATISDAAFQVQAGNFRRDATTPIKRTFLNLAGLVFSPANSTLPFNKASTKALGRLLDAGLRVLIAVPSDESAAANATRSRLHASMEWSRSISWYGEAGFAKLTATNDTSVVMAPDDGVFRLRQSRNFAVVYSVPPQVDPQALVEWIRQPVWTPRVAKAA